MKLKELLQEMQATQERIGSSKAYICGGTPRDRYLKHLERISDIDLTTGDKTVQYLSQEFGAQLSKKYNIVSKNFDDGHSAIHIGSFKMDFSSNFNVNGVDAILNKMGIKNPTEMQKEMFSRDFTCNSLLLDLDLQQVLDPTNRGLKDLDSKVIRTCLSPEVTLTSNKNRVIRAVYLSAKLGFDIDPAIIAYVQKNPQSVKISTEKALTDKLNEAFKYDADRAFHYLTKMGLWNEIPITESMQPYYMKRDQMTVKKGYFQGGGGVNEPTPGKKKYPSDPAIVNQTRFKEPFYKNYDLYDIPGFEHIGPGAGWHSMQNYKSVQEFLDAKRQKMKGKYEADDTWIDSNGNYTKKNPIKARAELLNKLVKIASSECTDSDIDWTDSRDAYYCKKCGHLGFNGPVTPKPTVSELHSGKDYTLKTARMPGMSLFNKLHAKFKGDENDGNNFDYGKGLYSNMDKYKSVDEFEEKADKGPGAFYIDHSHADYPLESSEIGGQLALPEPDAEGKLPTELDYGHNEEAEPAKMDDDLLDLLADKYVHHEQSSNLNGLPDGLNHSDEEEFDFDENNPEYGTLGPDSLMYEDKWNI